MTLALLWQEYLSGQASERLQLHAVLRGLRRLAQAGVADDATNALAGEKLSTGRGDSIAVADPATGKEGRAHVFVAALGAPGGRFAEPGDEESITGLSCAVAPPSRQAPTRGYGRAHAVSTLKASPVTSHR